MSKAEVIFAWPMPSDHSATVYEVILRADGTLSCSCPGWVFYSKKKEALGKPRSCKHTDRVSSEASGVYQAHLRGEKIKRRFVTTEWPKAEYQPPKPVQTRRVIVIE